MTVAEQMKETKKMMNTLTFMVDDIEEIIKMMESKKVLDDADRKVLIFAKHLQKYYQ